MDEYQKKINAQRFLIDTLRAVANKVRAENKRLKHCIDEIEAVSCGETQVAEDDSEGMGWIYKRIQALKDE